MRLVSGTEHYDIGVHLGLLAAISGAVFSWVGGHVDRAIGPMPVIVTCCLILIATAVLIISRPLVNYGRALAEGLCLPNSPSHRRLRLIGAAGGALQALARNMFDPSGATRSHDRGILLRIVGQSYIVFGHRLLIAVAANLIGQTSGSGSPRCGAVFIIGLSSVNSGVKPNGGFRK